MEPKVIEGVGQFLTDLQSAITAQDKGRVARLVHYPLRVVSDKGTRIISSENSFVRNYNTILTPEIRRVVLSERPECINVMSQGFVIGAGTVWFNSFNEDEFRIITLNPPIPPPAPVR